MTVEGKAPEVQAPRAADLKLTVIKPSRGWRALDLGELYAHRDLMGFLIWRDMKVRYQQTLLGGLWAILQPLATTATFTFVFGRLAKVPSDGIPYPLFSFTGLVIWNFFSGSFNAAVASLVESTQLIGKVYFPRLILPLSAACRGGADLAVAFACLLVMMLVYGVFPTWRALAVIPLTLVALAAATGLGAALGAINVRFRDVRHTIPLLTQMWLFLTPVAYPASLAPEVWRKWLALNPMTGVVEGFRWALLNSGPAPIGLMAISTASAVVMLVGGMAIFRRVEGVFADII
jgi:lipopolysaccharide transport system permease protein